MKKSSLVRLIAGISVAGLAVFGALPASAATVGSTKLAFLGSMFTWSVASPDGSKIFYVDESDPALYLYDVASNTIEAVADAGSDVSDPGQAVWTSDSSTIYVTEYDNSELLVVDAATSAITDTKALSGGPFSIAISPDGTELYVGLYSSDELAVYDLTTDTATRYNSINNPYAMFVTPDGSMVYSMNYGGEIDAFNTSTTNIDSWTNVSGDFYQGCVNSDVTMLYMPDNGGSQVLYAIDLSDGSIANQVTIADSDLLFGCAVSPDDLSVFVTDDNIGGTDGSDYTIITDPGVVFEVATADMSFTTSYDMDGLAYTTTIAFVDDCTAYVAGYYGNSQDLIYGLGCSSPTPELPNTGVDTTAMAVAGGIALVVLAAGTALLVLRRRNS